MSSIIGLFMRSKGVQLCTANSKLFKININLPAVGKKEYRYKALITLSSTSSRGYSSKVDAKIDGTTSNAISNEKEHIYRGLLSKNIRNIKFFSLSTSVIGLCIQPLAYTQIQAASTSSTLALPVFAMIGLMALGTPLLLNLVTKKYILDIDYVPSEDKYIASVYNLIGRKKKIEFTTNDVEIPTVLGMFTSCTIKGRPAFLDARSFKDQSHYVRIMGYDKPLDLLTGTAIKEPMLRNKRILKK